MTWLLLAMLGASILSWNSSLDRIEATQEYVEYTIEQQKIQEQKDIDQQKILEENFVEWFIARPQSLKKIKYRLWHFDADEKKFDCVWLFKWFAVEKWLLSIEEASYINSTVMYLLANPKPLSQAKRWDITYRDPIWDEPLKHIAFITRDYNPKEWGIWIIDNAPWNWGKIEERFLKMRWDVFVGRWKIKIGSNPFIEIAKNKNLEYNPIREYQWYFEMSRYYVPEPNQTSYAPYDISYEAALQRNCGWDCKNMAGKKTEYSDINKSIACPKEYKLWDKFRMVDDAWYERLVTCTDRGGDIKNKRLDLFAWFGEEWYQNIRQNKVPGWSQHLYLFNPLSKPKNESNKILRVLNTNGDVAYITKAK